MQISANHQASNIINNIFINSGTNNSELQEWKQLLTNIMEQFSCEEDELKPILQFLVMTITPSKIYKIEHTDTGLDSNRFIDLIIIIPSENKRPYSEMEPILEIPYIKEAVVCCSLHNEGTVINALNLGQAFYSLHCTPNNLVYDDKKLVYPITSPEIMSKIKQEIRNNFKQYIQRALDFAETAAYMLENRSSDIIVFLLHQAAELTFGGILKYLNCYEKKTHEIRALKKYIRRTAPQLGSFFPDDTAEEKRLLNLLENGYIKGRYELECMPSEEDLSILFERITSLQKAAIDIVSKVTE